MDGKKNKDENIVNEFLLDNPNKLDVFLEQEVRYNCTLLSKS